MNFMKRLIFLLAFLLITGGGYTPELSAQATNPPAARSFVLRGVVRQIADDRRTVTIQHEAVAGYMPAMTMAFTMRDTNQLSGISPSDEISFKLDVGENDSWIESIQFIAHRIENVTNNTFVSHIPTAELKPGDLLPDYEFVAEDGGKIHFSDFRGKAVAFTFFYSRCPLPDYCPCMSKNFSEARQLLLTTTNAPANWQLLTISFDPGVDTPEMLTTYANFYRGEDTNRWLFVVASTNTLSSLAPRLDLIIMRDGDSIMSHNLRTVVLDPQGRIFRQLDSNQWTPQQLTDAIMQAARGQTNSTK
jgi:protein SCO1/2